jgi:hypothetical protein
MKKKISAFNPFVVSFFFVLCIIGTQALYDTTKPPFTTKLAVARREFIPREALPYVHFGFKAVLADMYWIRTVQDFVAWDGKQPFFIKYFENISTLDPRFEYPYLFAIWTVPQNKNIETLDQIKTIADVGIVSIPNSWKIPFYLGTQYFLFTKTYAQAEYYLKLASEKKDVPPAVFLMYTNFVTNNIKGFRASQELIKTIYNTTDNETIKKIAEKGLQQEIVTQMIESALLAYKTKYGVYPATIEELKKKNFIALPENFSSLFTVVINQKNGSFGIVERKN